MALNNNIEITSNNIHFCNSSKMSKKEFKKELNGVKINFPEHLVFQKRSYFSLLTEWATHKILFKLGIKKDRTLCVDCDTEEKTIRIIGYYIIGMLTLPFL